MIGGLQGEFGDLDIKYVKQKISKCRLQISGSFRRNSIAMRATVQNGCEIFIAKGQHFRNGCNSFISTLNHVLFEELDC